jgi:predicted permease
MALFGEAGLALHIALVSLHALVLLSLATALAEGSLARERARAAGGGSLARTLMHTARQTVVHPVVLPILAGLAWNLTGLGLHPVVDEVLALLARAVVPLCLLLIGLSLAAYGLRAHWRGAIGLVLVKLFVAPALVLVVGQAVFGLQGLPLAVIVMLAALPVGTWVVAVAVAALLMSASQLAVAIVNWFAPLLVQLGAPILAEATANLHGFKDLQPLLMAGGERALQSARPAHVLRLGAVQVEIT